ncbi:AX2R protein, partial [Crocuta crocuta]
MKQQLRAPGKEAWDSAAEAPEPPPASLLGSRHSGLCPLPFYPVLDELAALGGGLPSELLSSPCWRLHWVYPPNQELPGAQSTSELRPARPPEGLWIGTRKPDASSGVLAPAEKPELLSHQRLPCTRTARLATEGWRRPESAHPSELRRPPAPARGSPVRTFSGCLDWIAHTAYTLWCRVSRSIFGTKEP